MASFFRLDAPNYRTDQDDSGANPIRMIEGIRLPGMICPTCGAWAGSRRLYLEISDNHLRGQLGLRPPIPRADWLVLADAVRRDAGLPANFDLQPGDLLGHPKANLAGLEAFDMMHPFPGQIIVSERVRQLLQDAHISGFHAERVYPLASQDATSTTLESPALYELVVTGQAWRVNSTLQSLELCATKTCGRMGFPYPTYLLIDTARWDGADLFHLDQNPNMIFATDRVCSTLAANNIGNFVCSPVPSE